MSIKKTGKQAKKNYKEGCECCFCDNESVIMVECISCATQFTAPNATITICPNCELNSSQI